MPQLGPVNWLFVYCFFWFVLMLLSVVFWWMKSNRFDLGVSGDNKKGFVSESGHSEGNMHWKW
uniref:ATP synthase F0 subunit 8 n=1 Tax=Cellana toreuma TaxID=42758 RepID=UPI0020286322|nr:ATP synthase F0 subunit 8 [Cellana toreuma]UPX89400.1 ATP synthase F0 subunit 8 [Cellana toreuma]